MQSGTSTIKERTAGTKRIINEDLPEQIEESERLDGEADHRMASEDEEESDRENYGSPQLGSLLETTRTARGRRHGEQGVKNWCIHRLVGT